MRAGTLTYKARKMLLLRLNRHTLLIPGFARVEQELEALKVKWDAQEAGSSVAAQNARAGTVVNLSYCSCFFFALVMALEFSGW